MFIVRNVSSRDVGLDDLHVLLSKEDQIDLDMVCSRFLSEQSPSLRHSIRSGMLKVVIKDDHRGGIQIKAVDTKPIVPEKPDNKEVLNAVKALEEKLGKRLEEKLATTQQQAIDPNLLTQAIAALQNIANIKPQTNTEKSQDTDLSDNKSVEIQQRMLNRKTANTQSNVTHHEQIVDNSDVKKNMDELEGLI